MKRIYVEKKNEFAVEARDLFEDIRENLGIISLIGVRIINRYDISGIDVETYRASRSTIFSEPPVDMVYDEVLKLRDDERSFCAEYLPGQYDQRADSAAQCIEIMTQQEKTEIRTAKVIVLKGEISDEDFQRIKDYCINPVDSREAEAPKPSSFNEAIEPPRDIEIVHGFIELDNTGIVNFIKDRGFAMSTEDLLLCRDYFKNIEGRNPTITELKLIDTYWSDHCRHTTFHTEILDAEVEAGKYSAPIDAELKRYISSRKTVYGEKLEKRPVSLMDIALIGMKKLKQEGKLKDLDESEEINACSIVVDVDVDGTIEKYLVMFKNETHNHPTEIEPFGGAATCLGGAIRDPLSGRAYVYQAMRVTGSGDPRTKVEDTISGKLPQRKITTEAAHGYSSYGNQIGIATGSVTEIYDEGYVAKRMEIGAVIAAAPYDNVVRKKPIPGDVIILLGGRTGRDGCGGATGSSKAHTEESITSCGAEVQKGNPPTERKLQRLFRKPEVSTMIKKCNDFGAGGVSVAIGELAEGLEINLDLIPKKYEGLDGTELAISESQERMAVVVSKEDADRFIEYSHGENLEATEVAIVTDDRRLKLLWRNKVIVDISRDFLDTNGAKQYAEVKVAAPDEKNNYFITYKTDKVFKDRWLSILSDLNVCSQKGLVERFDNSIGAGTVLMPFGGKYQLSPQEGMAAKIPLLKGETNTGTIMTFGFNPKLSSWSPFHGSVYSIVEAVTKVVALGGDYKKVRLTLQEYFERLDKDALKWGKPFSALLGALHCQLSLGIPAIGGKDSMSGSFKDMNVPPTLVAFGVAAMDVRKITSLEFKKVNSKIILLKSKRNEFDLPDFDILKNNYEKVNKLIEAGVVLAASSVRSGGICEALSKMSFGNKIGAEINSGIPEEDMFVPNYGSIILEIEEIENIDKLFSGISYIDLGKTVKEPVISFGNNKILIEDMLKAWQETLEGVFRSKTKEVNDNIELVSFNRNITIIPRDTFAKPRICIPVFPGTNCEYDSARAFERAGGACELKIFRNITRSDIQSSIDELENSIKNSQIIMIPGGFSGGDEPEGAAKFIATVFRNPKIKEAVKELLNNRDGLILGICNGFQALIKLGLVPYGEIIDMDEICPTLTYNKIGRHMSTMIQTKVVSKLSPWLSSVDLNDVHTIPMSHGEGRFAASEELIKKLFNNGQIATQYVDYEGNPTINMPFNPNGSDYAVEGITSPDGRVFGKMAHSERIGLNVAKNIPGNKDQALFSSGVDYFK